MYPLFERVHDRWTYEPLQELGQTPSGCRKWSQSWVWRSLVGALGVAAVFAITRAIYHKRRYSPLDQYQDLNQFPVTLDHAPDHSPVDRRAVVSSLYSDGFAIAVAVVGHSARSANVSARFLVPYPVPWIPPPHDGNGIHLRFMDQYTKLNVWALDKMGIDSAVYLDADTLVRRNFDELFDSPFNFAAVPDVDVHGGGFILSFNAGVLAFRPSSAVLKDMLQKLEVAEYPPEEAEQAFLNRYFAGTCMRLPFIYNANLGYKGRSPRLWKRLIDEMRIVHYTAVKPFIQDIHVTDTVLPAEEIEDAMEKSVLKKGGLYREEVGWWKDAYRKMMLDRGDAINQCL